MERDRPLAAVVAEGRSLILNGHIDVVPEARRMWAHNPLEPVVEVG